MNNKKRKMGSEILLKIKTHEEAAIDFLAEAKKKWVTSKLIRNNTINKEKRIVEYNPIYQLGSWNTFISSITGVLKSYGIKDDLIEVAGRSGYIFLINVCKDIMRVSSIRKLPLEIWEIIKDGVESFGWKLYHHIDFLNSEEKIENTSRIFNNVQDLIIKFEKPIILWGLPTTSYGIVLGYDNYKYIVSTDRIADKKNDDPIHFDKLTLDYWAKDETNYVDLFYLADNIEKKDQNSIDMQSIKRAITLAKGLEQFENIYENKFINGPNAYDIWIESLKNVKNEPNIIHANSYLAEVYHNARELASQYLERLSKRYENYPQSIHLKQSAKEYSEVQYYFRKYSGIFPFFNQFEANLTQIKRKQGIETLKFAQKHEKQALEYLEEALSVWKN